MVSSNTAPRNPRKRSRQHSSAQPQQTASSTSLEKKSTTSATATATAATMGDSAATTATATTYLATANGSAVRRIRTPHPHDVLSGRGGGINGHPGNVRFREWVRVRKNDYNLALNKAEKAHVAREVIQQVLDQNPPGRFLQKDPSSVGSVGWWIELDDERVLAKTAQALREGAPQIRAEHRDEQLLSAQSHSHSHHGSPNAAKRRAAAAPAQPQPQPQPQPPQVDAVVEQLRTNAWKAAAAAAAVEAAPSVVPPEGPPATKRVRVDYNGHILYPTDETPPLLPAPHPPLPADLALLEESSSPSLPPPLPSRGDGGLKRVHSLALSDVSFGDWATEDFVNPFEGDELNRLEALRSSGIDGNKSKDDHQHHFHSGHHPSTTSRPGVLITRESSSNSSHGDLGGLAALLGSGPLDISRRNSSSSTSTSANNIINGKGGEGDGNAAAISGVRSRNSSLSAWSTRALTPLPSDFADRSTSSGSSSSARSSSIGTLPTAPPTEAETTDFTEGMKAIYNALHSDDFLDEGREDLPNLWYPYNRGGPPLVASQRRPTPGWAWRPKNDGRQ